MGAKELEECNCSNLRPLRKGRAARCRDRITNAEILAIDDPHERLQGALQFPHRMWRPGGGLSTASSIRSSISRPRSIASSANTTLTTPNPSSGRPILMKSSQLETAGSKRWNQSTLVWRYCRGNVCAPRGTELASHTCQAAHGWSFHPATLVGCDSSCPDDSAGRQRMRGLL